MKINTRNLNGILDCGAKYRIVFQDEYDEIFKNRVIYVKRQVFNAVLEDWFTREVISKSYNDIKHYKEALKNALLEAEQQWKVQLLKAELKIAI